MLCFWGNTMERFNLWRSLHSEYTYYLCAFLSRTQIGWSGFSFCWSLTLKKMWKFRSQLYRDICHRHELYKCKCNLPVLLEILIVCSCTPIFGIKAVFDSKSALTGDHSLTKAYHLTISGAEENRSMSTLDDCALIQRLDWRSSG